MNEKQIFTIQKPQPGDELALAHMHVKAWKESYITPESGVTDAMVDEMVGHMLTNTDFRKQTIFESLAHPDRVLYRNVKNSRGDIVGFLHGEISEDYNELHAIYLLNEAKGTGVSGKLMDEFLSWMDKGKPCHLEVFTFNNHAIEFYARYGFVPSNKPVQLYKDKLPFIEMVRPSKLELSKLKTLS